jgi:hypothetical protein
MKPNPNQKLNDVMSSSFQINITICDVDQETRHRLTTTIERKLRKAAVTVLIAENETDLTRWDLTCAIVYPKPTKQSAVIRNIRSEYIPPCFPEGMRIPGKQRNWLVTARPFEPFNADDSAFWKMHNLWSLPPWTMVHAGPGAAARRVARQEGSRFPLTFPKLDLDIILFKIRIRSFIARPPRPLAMILPNGIQFVFQLLHRIGTTLPRILGRPTRCCFYRCCHRWRVWRVWRCSRRCAAAHVDACRDCDSTITRCDGSVGAAARTRTAGTAICIPASSLERPWGPAPWP